MWLQWSLQANMMWQGMGYGAGLGSGLRQRCRVGTERCSDHGTEGGGPTNEAQLGEFQDHPVL